MDSVSKSRTDLREPKLSNKLNDFVFGLVKIVGLVDTSAGSIKGQSSGTDPVSVLTNHLGHLEMRYRHFDEFFANRFISEAFVESDRDDSGVEFDLFVA